MRMLVQDIILFDIPVNDEHIAGFCSRGAADVHIENLPLRCNTAIQRLQMTLLNARRDAGSMKD